MPSKHIYFDAESVLRLLTHYTEGVVPVDAELRGAGVSQYLQQWIGLDVESNGWSGAEVPGGGLPPLHIRYEGRKVMIFQGGPEDPVVWTPQPEAPRGPGG